MADKDRPSLERARKTLPAPLLEALRHVFRQRLSGCWLVGGTALAGFYAGHRRSDDIDLFARDADSRRAAALAVESLGARGAEVEVLHDSAQYFKAVCRLSGHAFTADVALHAGLFETGRAVTLEGGLAVADLETMTMLKAAALVSRCGEKDLYDLLWLTHRDRSLTWERLVELGLRIDAGATPEGLLMAVSGAPLSREACGFALKPRLSPAAVYSRIRAFQRRLLRGLARLAGKEPPPPIADLVERARRLGRKPPGRP